jgi:hypothetical protein
VKTKYLKYFFKEFLTSKTRIKPRTKVRLERSNGDNCKLDSVKEKSFPVALIFTEWEIKFNIPLCLYIFTFFISTLYLPLSVTSAIHFSHSKHLACRKAPPIQMKQTRGLHIQYTPEKRHLKRKKNTIKESCRVL